jgi:heme o synthase
MAIQEAKIADKSSHVLNYLNLIKPRETTLLVFIGVVTAIVAGRGAVPAALLLVTLATILVASAGANGLTNYLDRKLDARMERTRRRALPSGRIHPAEKALYFTAALSVIGLVLAWRLSPLAFIADLVSTSAAVIYRKKVTCVFPQGMIASCAPVLMGWFAVTPAFSWEIVILCILIGVWLPSHIWSIMVAHREDYIKAGITYFPISADVRTTVRILFLFCLLLYAASLGLFYVGHYGYLYLVAANILGIIILYGSFRLMLSSSSGDAWKLYKISAFPYLGLLFLFICLDAILRI